MRLHVLLIAFLGMCIALTGCQNGLPGLAKEFSPAPSQITTGIMDQSVVEKFLANASGQAQNPGIRISYIDEKAIEYKMIGTAGQFGLSADGTGKGKLSNEARQAIIKLAEKDPSLAEKAFEYLSVIKDSDNVKPKTQKEPTDGGRTDDGIDTGGGGEPTSRSLDRWQHNQAAQFERSDSRRET